MQIKWLRSQGVYRKLITANKHTIKLWKIFEKSTAVVDYSPQSNFNFTNNEG